MGGENTALVFCRRLVKGIAIHYELFVQIAAITSKTSESMLCGSDRTGGRCELAKRGGIRTRPSRASGSEYPRRRHHSNLSRRANRGCLYIS